jgi:hypothetical protein
MKFQGDKTRYFEKNFYSMKWKMNRREQSQYFCQWHKCLEKAGAKQIKSIKIKFLERTF